MDWSDDEIERRMRETFIKAKPLNDYTMPFVALLRGGKVARELRRHFGEIGIEDMPLPFFCMTSDLTSGLATAPHDETADRHRDKAQCGQHADHLVQRAEQLALMPGDAIADDPVYDVLVGKPFAREFLHSGGIKADCLLQRHIQGV